MKLGILTGFNDWKLYVEACEELKVDYTIVDILSADWLQNLKKVKNEVDGFLCRPPCLFQEVKNVYDERLFFIKEYFHKPLYPNYNSLYIYENKRNMAAFLEMHAIPHVDTRVFIDKQSALEFVESAHYPLVQKSNIGAGGSAVTVLRNKKNAKRVIRKVFGLKNGLFSMGLSPVHRKFGIPFKFTGCAQKHYVIFQPFHEIKWEWRILKVGNSYFGHQKLLKGNKASGSGLVGWVQPPEKLLYMAKDICDKGRFDVMDVDIFETVDGKFLVNEIQAIFGSYLPYQMKVDGKPGRYIYDEEKGFLFEEGEFNRYGSKLLFVEDFLRILKKKDPVKT